MKYDKWDYLDCKLVEMDTDTDNLFNIWHYEIKPHYDPDVDDVIVEQGWMLVGAVDSKEELHPNILNSRDYKVTFNGKEIHE